MEPLIVEVSKITEFLAACKKYTEGEAQRVMVQSQIASMSNNPQMVKKAQDEVNALKEYVSELRKFSGIFADKKESES